MADVICLAAHRRAHPTASHNGSDNDQSLTGLRALVVAHRVARDAFEDERAAWLASEAIARYGIDCFLAAQLIDEVDQGVASDERPIDRYERLVSAATERLTVRHVPDPYGHAHRYVGRYMALEASGMC